MHEIQKAMPLHHSRYKGMAFQNLSTILARQDADDFRTCIVNLAKRRDAGLDLRLEVFWRGEVSALQKRRLRLVRLEEFPYRLEKIFWLRIFRAEENIACHIAELWKDMQERVPFGKQRHDRILIIYELLRTHIDDVAPRRLQDLLQALLDGFHLL